MPAGVRVQQLTPVIRTSSNQPTTIVRLMSPGTSTIRPGTGQQQIIHLNTNKQQQPLVIKAITASSSSNRQQQPILLTSNTQSKTLVPQTQQQVLVLNQGQQQQKFTLQMTNVDQSNYTNNNNSQQKSTTDNTIPQLDGIVDDQVNIFIFNSNKKKSYSHYFLF